MTTTDGAQSTRTTSPALIAVAWLLVGLPLSWGVTKSALNAAKLFQPAAASASPQTAPVSAAPAK